MLRDFVTGVLAETEFGKVFDFETVFFGWIEDLRVSEVIGRRLGRRGVFVMAAVVSGFVLRNDQ